MDTTYSIFALSIYLQTRHALAGDRLGTYNGHTDAILSVAWSPNGRYLVSGSADATVRIWRDPSMFL